MLILERFGFWSIDNFAVVIWYCYYNSASTNERRFIIPEFILRFDTFNLFLCGRHIIAKAIVFRLVLLFSLINDTND